MIDLHMHTLHSDGQLIPAELMQRARERGYQAMALTDHADHSNLEAVVNAAVAAAREYSGQAGMLVLAGVEITHVPPRLIGDLIARARSLGAEIVLVHGESPVEPVPPGTNRAAIMGKADILAHPGLLTPEEARMARRLGVALEITSRAGHSLGNGHAGKIALAAGCGLVVNSDTHAPRDLHTPDFIRRVVLGAGLPVAQIKACQALAWKIARRAK